MPRQKGIEYRMVNKSGKPTEDMTKVTKVIADLKSQKATAATKLALQFQKILEERKRLETEEENLKIKGRTTVADLFDAKDEILTRVAETASVVMQISKASERTDIKLDVDGLLNAIGELAPELIESIKALREKYTSETKTPVSPKFSVSLKSKTQKESMWDTIWQKMKGAGKSFLSLISEWGKMYDSRLDAVKQQLRTELGMNYESVENTNYSDYLTERFDI
jgi:hypothetical protein